MSFPMTPISLPRRGTTTRLRSREQPGLVPTFAVSHWLAAVEEAEPARVVMLHSERGAMELSDVVASNAHDASHHRWDLQRILQSP